MKRRRSSRYARRYHRRRFPASAAGSKRPSVHQDALRLRPAVVGDLVTLVRLLAAAFGESEEDVTTGMRWMLEQPDRRHYLAMLGDEPIGIFIPSVVAHPAMKRAVKIPSLTQSAQARPCSRALRGG